MRPDEKHLAVKRYSVHSQRSFAINFLVFLLIGMTYDPALALRNPAAVYCEAMGYEYMIFYEKQGARGACNLPRNPVDAWDFLKGKVGQVYSYCSSEGYGIRTVAEPEKCSRIFSDECAVCLLTDGSEVEVTAMMALTFAETTCGDGSCGTPENYSSCPEDCPPGGWDDYCDGLDDGTCDPDCLETKAHDPDCFDTDGDNDVDGKDLAAYIFFSKGLGLDKFAENFGKVNYLNR